MPSARLRVAVLGQAATHDGSSQCWQPTGTNTRLTEGYSPNSMSITRRHCTPGGVAFVTLHAAVQVWQPTQRRKSATIAQRVIGVSPRVGAGRSARRQSFGCVCVFRAPPNYRFAYPAGFNHAILAIEYRFCLTQL
jgi:hypothetical protein